MSNPAGWAGVVQEFILLYLACYGGLLALYFGTGTVLQWMCARHPERRIQTRKMRDRTALDIRQSVLSLSNIALYLAGGLYAQHLGWTLFAPLPLSIWSAVLMFAVSIVLYDAWFYWFHRFAHVKWMFRFHALHHRSIQPNAWSNNSDTLVGTFLEQGYFLFAPLVLPIPPVVLIAHKIFDQVTGMGGHAGYEFFASPTTRKPWPTICTTFHDQHHAYFRCNYANTFSYWDRLMGTLHPRYDETVEKMERIGATQPMDAK